MQEFSKPQYAVDVLKVELPVNPAFMAGNRAFRGEGIAYSRQEASQHLRTLANATSLPFIFLSGGVTDEVFLDMLELVAEAGVKFSGVLCGLATWQGGIAPYANEGIPALEHWLEEHGTQKIQAINALLARCATSWWDAHIGKDAIELT